MVRPFMNLKPYLDRIGYVGPLAPTIAVLREIVLAHACSIPFENLDVLLDRGISLDDDAVERKLVHDRRGGYCFEQNIYFQQVLVAMGFRVRAVAARVFWRALNGEVPPRNHMVLLVTLDDGDYLADVGFGLLKMWSPLRVEPFIEQHTPIGVYRLMPAGQEVLVQLKRNGRWAGRYQVSMHEQAPADWDVAHYYMSTHPSSPFTTNLMAARSKGDARYCLLNNKLQIHHDDGTARHRVLKSAEELEEVLRNDFDIGLSENCATEVAHVALKK